MKNSPRRNFRLLRKSWNWDDEEVDQRWPTARQRTRVESPGRCRHVQRWVTENRSALPEITSVKPGGGTTRRLETEQMGVCVCGQQHMTDRRDSRWGWCVCVFTEIACGIISINEKTTPKNVFILPEMSLLHPWAHYFGTEDYKNNDVVLSAAIITNVYHLTRKRRVRKVEKKNKKKQKKQKEKSLSWFVLSWGLRWNCQTAAESVTVFTFW